MNSIVGDRNLDPACEIDNDHRRDIGYRKSLAGDMSIANEATVELLEKNLQAFTPTLR